VQGGSARRGCCGCMNFFRVCERARNKGKCPLIYQALQFKVGTQLAEGVVEEEMSDTIRQETRNMGTRCMLRTCEVCSKVLQTSERVYVSHR
jgi:hypothetical protein